jgi:tetratricopeptide (TPR) repeat protein
MQRTTEKPKMVFARALEIAEDLDDVNAQLMILTSLWSSHWICGEARMLKPIAGRVSDLRCRSDDPVMALTADRLIGTALHCEGKQRDALRHLERAFETYVVPDNQRDMSGFAYHQHLFARSTMARVLWLRGLANQAVSHAEASLNEAEATGRELALGWIIHHAVHPLAAAMGDLAATERMLTSLNSFAKDLTPSLRLRARCLQGVLLIRQGEFERGVELLRATLDICLETGWKTFYPESVGVLAEGCARLGQVTEALAAVDEAVRWADNGGDCWYVAELLRIKGELLLDVVGEASTSAAEDCFRQAIQVAREQGALSWELRTALSFARLKMGQDREDDARQILEPVYNQFTEGFETVDLRSARAMLQSL